MNSPSFCNGCYILNDALFEDNWNRKKKESAAGSEKSEPLIAPHIHSTYPAIYLKNLQKPVQGGCKFCYLVQQACSMLPDTEIVEMHIKPDSSPVFVASRPRKAIEIYTPEDLALFEYIKNGPYASDTTASLALTKFLCATDVPSKSDSDESFAFLENCFIECIQTHKLCRQPTKTSPKRLVKIYRPYFRLIESKGNSKIPYAALSYCWGGENPLRTTKETIAEMKRGIEWSMIPPVFRDAAKVALRLGIQYLWIDALCIIQDDETDWELEAAKMATIYENAQITIAASSSQRPSDPFLGPRTWIPREMTINVNGMPMPFKAREKIRLGHHYSHIRDERDPLELRGWALQEQELSTRFISYTTAELQWSCKTLTACECCRVVISSSTNPKSDFKTACILGKQNSIQEQYQHQFLTKLTAKLTKLMHYPAMFDNRSELNLSEQSISAYLPWHCVVQNYTQRELTKVEDKLPAILGLATKLCEYTRSEYYSGLWRHNILIDLAWARETSPYFVTKFDPIITFSGPTYSWASIPGPISYQLGKTNYPGRRKFHTRLIEAYNHSTGGSNPHLSSKPSLRLCGPTTAGTLSYSDSHDAATYRVHIQAENQTRYIGETIIDAPIVLDITPDNTAISYLSIAIENQDPCPKGGERIGVKLLNLFTLQDSVTKEIYDLILILVRLSRDKKSYKRIGIISSSFKSDYILEKSARSFETLKLELGCTFDISENDNVLIF